MQAQIHAQAHASAVALATTARNLQFLALIEATVDIVSTDTEHVRVCARAVEACMAELKTQFANSAISDEARLVELLDKTLDIARRLHLDAKKRHESACNDKMLHPDDGVTDVFADLVEATEELFDCAAEFKDWIETHNSMFEEASGATYTTAEALIAALKAD